MTVRELITQVRDVLQDTDGNYFSDSEFINMYNECKRYLSSERKENPSTISVTVYDSVYEYDIDNVLRYISAKDSNGNTRTLYPDDSSGDEDTEGIIVQDYNRIYINTPNDGDTISLKVITFPLEDNLNDTIRLGDESSYKYYILSKAYEKDTDLEQFQKAQYFAGMFAESAKYAKKNAKLKYLDKVQTTKGYYY